MEFPSILFLSLLINVCLTFINCHFYFRHGLGRTDFYILNDPELSFREIVQKNLLSAVSGSFTAEILEATKLETAKTETTKIEIAKTEVIKSEAFITEITKTEETIKSEVTKTKETDKTEIVDSDVKLESSELQKIEVEKEKTEINESVTCEKIESTNSEFIINNKKLDNDNNVVETNETPLNDKSEPMEVVDQEEYKDKQPNISDDNSKQEKVSDIQIEESTDKSSEIIDEPQDTNKTEIIIENKQTEKQEKNLEELSINEIENTITNDDIQSKPELNSKEAKDANSDIPSDSSSKLDLKVTDSLLKSKECSTSVESVDRLKAMFPELEVVHKDVSTPTIDKLPMHKPLQQIDQTIAHLLATSYQNPIKWPKVKLLKCS